MITIYKINRWLETQTYLNFEGKKAHNTFSDLCKFFGIGLALVVLVIALIIIF